MFARSIKALRSRSLWTLLLVLSCGALALAQPETTEEAMPPMPPEPGVVTPPPPAVPAVPPRTAPRAMATPVPTPPAAAQPVVAGPPVAPPDPAPAAAPVPPQLQTPQPKPVAPKTGSTAAATPGSGQPQGGMPQGQSPSTLGNPAFSMQDRVGPIVLVDENAYQVLALLEQLTGKVVLQQQTLPATKINFNSRGQISREEAILALESLLSLNGVAVTPLGGNFVKAVPIAGVGTQAPQILQDPASSRPASQKVYAKLYRLEFLSAPEALPLIQPFLSPGMQIVPFEKTNAVLITDTLVNLQRVEALLSRIDTPPDFKDQILFLQLRHTKASDLLQRLQRLQQGSLKRYLQGNTTFEGDDRTNQILVLTHPSNVQVIRKLVESLDIDVDPLTSSEVFFLRHATAKDVAAVLKEIISGQQKTQDKNAPKTGNIPPENQATTVNPAGTTTNEAGRIPGTEAGAPQQAHANVPSGPEGIAPAAVQFSPYVTIVADERSNAIVSYGTSSDLRQLGGLIKKIDVLLAQVQVEVVIVEVSLSNGQVSGLSNFGINYNNQTMGGAAGPGAAHDYGMSTSSGVVPGGDKPAFEFAGSVQNLSLGAVFRTAQQDNNVRVLSSPTIVTTHNQEATINVSQSQPIITQATSYVPTSGTTSTTQPITSNVQYRDIGIILKVKPLIGANGVIQLKVDQTVENVFNNTLVNGTPQPLIGKRQAQSFVSVSDGEVVVLAGLQQVDTRDNKGKVFLLGYIPIVGEIFKPKTKEENRRELIIFIRPRIINGTTEADFITQQRLNNSPVGTEVKDFFEDGRFANRKEEEKPKPKAPPATGPRR